MHRYWTDVIAMVFDAVAPGRALLIGSGRTTSEQVRVLQRNGCALDIADPFPNADLLALVRQFEVHHRLHVMTGLQALPLLQSADIALLDGDSNWFTVFRELQWLFARAIEADVAAPLVLVHEAGWPYARRDRYDEPGHIPERHDFACRGIIPGQSALADGGVNGRYLNALHEGGPANGVLTAIEDFMAGWPQPVTLHVLPFLGGLAVLVPQMRMTDRVAVALAAIAGTAALTGSRAVLEQDRVTLLADLEAHRLSLARRSEALVKARSKIIELERILAVAPRDRNHGTADPVK